MNRLKSPLRRMLAATAGALLGMTGALALAGSADAQTPSGRHKCVSAADAKYEHKFEGRKGTASITLLNGPLCEDQEFALVSYIAPSGRFELPQYAFDSSVQKFPAQQGNERGRGGYKPKLKFKVKVPPCYAQVDFVRGGRIIDPLIDPKDLYGSRKLGAWNGGYGPCIAPEVKPVSDCDGNVVVKLSNEKGKTAAYFVVTGDNFTKAVKVDAGKTDEVRVPAANAKNIVVTANGKQVHKGGWVKPDNCTTPQKPTGFTESNCDYLIIGLKNPAGNPTITVTLTPNKGEPQTLVVEPGKESNPPAKFKGVKGLTVTPSGAGLQDTTPIVWTPPADCDKPSGSGGGDPDEDILPVTGAAAGGMAAGAVALLTIGAVLFFVARRRRITFTA